MTQPHDEHRKNPIGILRFFTSAGTPSKDVLSHFGHFEYDAMIKKIKMFDATKVLNKCMPASNFRDKVKMFDKQTLAGFFQNIHSF